MVNLHSTILEIIVFLNILYPLNETLWKYRVGPSIYYKIRQQIDTYVLELYFCLSFFSDLVLL